MYIIIIETIFDCKTGGKMSHSKHTRRGRSYYLEKWNRPAKKYVNTCAICGKSGYSPAVEEESFRRTAYGMVISRELKAILPLMELDSLGRCPDCAAVHEKVLADVQKK